MAWLPTKPKLQMLTMVLIVSSAMALLAAMAMYPIWSWDKPVVQAIPHEIWFKDLGNSRGAGKALMIWFMLAGSFAALVLQPVFWMFGPSVVSYVYEWWMEAEFPSEWILNMLLDTVNSYWLSVLSGTICSAAGMLWFMTAPDEQFETGFYLIFLAAALESLGYASFWLTRFAPDEVAPAEEEEEGGDHEEDPFRGDERSESIHSYGSDQFGDEDESKKDRWKKKFSKLGSKFMKSSHRDSEASAAPRSSTRRWSGDSELDSPKESGWGWW